MISYMKELKSVLSKLDLVQVNKVIDMILDSPNIYVVGNGGSHATAEHFATDLIKLGNKRAFTLSNLSQLTMAANDYSYSHSFSWLLRKYCLKDDLVIGISTSGASQNILRSLFFDARVNTVLITGVKGKKMASKADSCIIIESDDTQIIEDISLIICHMISKQLMERNIKCKK